jgi:uncharacterized protein (DUF1697 family)
VLYIALLRGINVGGHVVKMDRLRQLFEEVGLGNVRSYIQSGNVFFEAPEGDEVAVAKKIEAHLKDALGYDVPVILRTVEELDAIVALDPFKNFENRADVRFAVNFTAGKMPLGLDLPLKSAKNDAEIIAMTEREAFAIWYIFDGRPPANSFFAKNLPKDSTSRFYHTMLKILEAAKAGICITAPSSQCERRPQGHG